MDFKSQSAAEIYNRFRALGDLGKLSAVWEATNIRVRFADLVNPENTSRLDVSLRYPSAEPGETVLVRTSKSSRFICIKAKCGGWVAFEKFYYGKKKAMRTKEFYSGFMNRQQRQVERLRFVAEDLVQRC